MSTIQELIDGGEIILGETKICLINQKEAFLLLIAGKRPDDWSTGWYVQEEDGVVSFRNNWFPFWKIYEEPEVMETRWQWATTDGRESTMGFYADVPEQESRREQLYSVRLDFTETQFPKTKEEKKDD